MSADIRTIPGMLELGAQRYGDAEAVVDGEVRLSFAALREEARKFARAAVARGIQPGDRVAVWAPNGHRWVIAAMGLLTAGAVLVPVNTRYKGGEARYLLMKARVRLLVVDDGFLGNHYLDMLRDGARPAPGSPVPGLPQLAAAVVLGNAADDAALTWPEFIAAGDAVPPGDIDRRAAAIRPDDLSDIFFTSGTTGRPKGVMTTHAQNLRVYEAYGGLAGIRDGDRYLLVNPIFHTFGYKAGVLASIMRGATIITQPVFDVAATLRLVAQEKVTVLPGPPTLYYSILNHPERDRYDLSSLRLAMTGGTVVPVALIERMRSHLSFRTIITGYGLTESSGTATMCQPEDDAETIATTSGRAIPGTEVAVVDEKMTPLRAGEAGEIVVRGYNVMRGYLDDEAATAAAITADGWLRTGDVGMLDARGNLQITGRIKDMFVVGGFNVYPAEIEQVLATHEAVSEAAVIGVADPRMGEVGRAYVIPRQGTDPAEAEIIAYCRERLANFKVPRSVVFTLTLPRNASGKVLKQELRDPDQA